MKVMVAMSGGVDSSVSAYLLKEEGFDVTGVTLRLWGGDGDSGCCSVSDVEDARRAAFKIGIKHRVINMAEVFDDFVVNPYVESHKNGLTPNPCIECNRKIKFDALLKSALKLGFDYLATGHYALVQKGSSGFRMLRAKDKDKDQSYVLSMLSQQQLSRLIFPLGELEKKDVREIAKQIGLSVATKPDSQDVCFIHSATGRKGFLGKYMAISEGKLVDERTNEVIGETDALELLTIGQRKGVPAGKLGQRRFVTRVDLRERKAYVGPFLNLLVSKAKVKDVTFVNKEIKSGTEIYLQASAHGSPFKGVFFENGELIFKNPQKKVAPGQTIAFYDSVENKEVLGSGVVLL